MVHSGELHFFTSRKWKPAGPLNTTPQSSMKSILLGDHRITGFQCWKKWSPPLGVEGGHTAKEQVGQKIFCSCVLEKEPANSRITGSIHVLIYELLHGWFSSDSPSVLHSALCLGVGADLRGSITWLASLSCGIHLAGFSHRRTSRQPLEWSEREVKVLIPLSLLAFHGPGGGFLFSWPQFLSDDPLFSYRSQPESCSTAASPLGVYG